MAFGNPLRGAIVVAGTLLAMAAGTAVVVGQSRIEDRLTKATTLKCAFTVMTTGTWKAGEPQAEIKPAKLSMGFDGINADEGTARVIGAFGPSDIIVRMSYGTLHFVQSFREGPLYTTTIFPKETKPGRLQAVHTRHEYTEVSLPGFTSRPEQYYGDCAIE
jgi:hypothetical protein